MHEYSCTGIYNINHISNHKPIKLSVFTLSTRKENKMRVLTFQKASVSVTNNRTQETERLKISLCTWTKPQTQHQISSWKIHKLSVLINTFPQSLELERVSQLWAWKQRRRARFLTEPPGTFLHGRRLATKAREKSSILPGKAWREHDKWRVLDESMSGMGLWPLKRRREVMWGREDECREESLRDREKEGEGDKGWVMREGDRGIRRWER